MIRIYIIVFLVGSSLMSSCQVFKKFRKNKDEVSTRKINRESYTEDLTSQRPDYSKKVQAMDSSLKVEESAVSTESKEWIDLSSNLEVNSLIDTIAVQFLTKNSIKGYSIQIHNGTSRSVAVEIMGQLLKTYPDVESVMQFKQPFFRVKIGRFMDELQAVRLLKELKAEYPTAILVPDTFAIVEEENER